MNVTKVTNINELMDMLLQAVSVEDLSKELYAAQARKTQAEERARREREKEEQARREREKAAKELAEKQKKQEMIAIMRQALVEAMLDYIKVISPEPISEEETESYYRFIAEQLKYCENVFMKKA